MPIEAMLLFFLSRDAVPGLFLDLRLDPGATAETIRLSGLFLALQ